MAVADALQYSGHLLSIPPADPRPPLGYIIRVENMEAQHIHHPEVLVVADDPAELRAIEAALAAHPTTVVPATPGEPSASGSLQLASAEQDDLESFGSSPSDRGIIRGPPPPLPVNRPIWGEPRVATPAPAGGLISHDAAPSVPGQWQVRSYTRRVSRRQHRRRRPWTQFRSSYVCLSPVFSGVSAVFCPGCIDPTGVLANTTAPMAHEGGRQGSWRRAARAAARAAQAPDAPAIAQAADGVVTLLRRRPLPLRMKVLLYRPRPPHACRPRLRPRPRPLPRLVSQGCLFCDRCPPIKMVGPLSKADSGKGPGVPEAAAVKEPGRGCKAPPP